jgi:hypothetical protein
MSKITSSPPTAETHDLARLLRESGFWKDQYGNHRGVATDWLLVAAYVQSLITTAVKETEQRVGLSALQPREKASTQ